MLLTDGRGVELAIEEGLLWFDSMSLLGSIGDAMWVC